MQWQVSMTELGTSWSLPDKYLHCRVSVLCNCMVWRASQTGHWLRGTAYRNRGRASWRHNCNISMPDRINTALHRSPPHQKRLSHIIVTNWCHTGTLNTVKRSYMHSKPHQVGTHFLARRVLAGMPPSGRTFATQMNRGQSQGRWHRCSECRGQHRKPGKV